MAVQNIKENAATLNLSANELFREALISLLKDKKREVLQARLEVLARYGVISVAELATKIGEGSVVEHPAWEDLVVAENLTARLEELLAIST